VRDDLATDQQRAEPAINAPWPVIVLIAVLAGAHWARTALSVDADRWALTAPDLAAGHWDPLVTHLFVHAGWTHLIMNSLFILAFGAPVARFLRTSFVGALLFWLFFLGCGVIAGSGYAFSEEVLARFGLGRMDFALVGASGAASGLMGAAVRLIEGRGRLGPVFGRTVVGMSFAWILVNLALGLTGLTPGTAGAPIAWQAHVIGYFAGLFLVTPFAWASKFQAGQAH
jgi:membrane associated rhomboid family serine protease